MSISYRFLFLLLLMASSLSAQNLPTLKFVSITAVVRSDGDTYTYHYAVANSSVSLGAVWTIALDVSQPLDGTQMSSVGLVSGPGFLENTSKAVAARPETVPMVALAAQAPPGWICSEAVNGKLVWGAEDQAGLIPAGSETKGFQVSSRGLPTIRTVVLEPFLDLNQLPIVAPSDPSDLIRYDNELAAVEASVRFSTRTVGPTAPPDNFDSVDFLSTIDSYREESLKQRWIDHRELSQSIAAKIDRAKQELLAGNTDSARSRLEELIDEVENQADKHLSSEAVALLKFNTLFLIGKLPDKHQHRDNRDHAPDGANESVPSKIEH